MNVPGQAARLKSVLRCSRSGQGSYCREQDEAAADPYSGSDPYFPGREATAVDRLNLPSRSPVRESAPLWYTITSGQYFSITCTVTKFCSQGWALCLMHISARLVTACALVSCTLAVIAACLHTQDCCVMQFACCALSWLPP